MSEKVYDTLVVGGGPAGYTAALYATRAGLDTLLLEKLSAGGQMTETAQIDNYPGFAEGVDGFSLGDAMKRGAERFGARTVQTEVLSMDLRAVPKRITTDTGELLAHTVILAMGAAHRHLGVEREQELVGKGVGYCAACDGMFYRGKTVAVVGGGNSAVADALLLSRICKKVYLIHRRAQLRATRVYHDALMKAENVTFLWDSRVVGLLSEKKGAAAPFEALCGVTVEHVRSMERSELVVDGLFISVGRAPASSMVADQLTLDESGYIVADESTETNLPGVFVAGDVRTKAVRQIVTATADGAVAAHAAEEYLARS